MLMLSTNYRQEEKTTEKNKADDLKINTQTNKITNKL